MIYLRLSNTARRGLLRVEGLKVDAFPPKGRSKCPFCETPIVILYTDVASSALLIRIFLCRHAHKKHRRHSSLVWGNLVPVESFLFELAEVSGMSCFAV
jgi:hypothetical protein